MGVQNKRTRTKTRRYVRDIDQVKADLFNTKHLMRYTTSKPKEDLPGLGQWYCIQCAKWFESENSLTTHRKGKGHRRRIKALKDEPYTQKEADAAIGLHTDNTRQKSKDEDSQAMEVEAGDVDAS